MTVIAYARTSTAEQLAGLAAQERDLRASGAERIVSEQISSMADRPGLTDCLAALQQGDVLMVTKPDRLARSTGHLLTIVDDLNRRGVGLVVLSMGGERIDTRNATGRLMLTMLGAIAEFERSLMAERQKEGIAKAKADGRYVGGKRRLDWAQVVAMADDIGRAATARELGIGISSVYRILAEARA